MVSMPRVSLPDTIFWPLAAAVTGALIWGAMQYRPSGQDAVVTATSFVMEGAALDQLIPGPGTRSMFDPAAAGGPVARLTATASREAAGHLSAGVGAVIPPEFEAAVVGRDIEVRVEMRAASPDLTHAHIGYFVVGDADTGWRQVEVGTVFRTLTLRHHIPAGAPLGGIDWVGIWPDEDGSGRPLLVRRIEVRILEGAAAE
ncbi:MAG: hypothetical protein GC187_06510 [Alphaproteobacteria bacterium]|nr:hypothetical protein [Alphaproteobacteria bacterium]